MRKGFGELLALRRCGRARKRRWRGLERVDVETGIVRVGVGKNEVGCYCGGGEGTLDGAEFVACCEGDGGFG